MPIISKSDQNIGAMYFNHPYLWFGQWFHYWLADISSLLPAQNYEQVPYASVDQAESQSVINNDSRAPCETGSGIHASHTIAGQEQ